MRLPIESAIPALSGIFCGKDLHSLPVEYFELLEDAMVSPDHLERALVNWKQFASQAHVLEGMATAL